MSAEAATWAATLGVVCIADMDSILLIMRLFLAGFFGCCSATCSWCCSRKGTAGDGGERDMLVASEGAWAERVSEELARSGSLAAASKAAARCLLLPIPSEPEIELEVELSSCEVVTWRWKRRCCPDGPD